MRPLIPVIHLSALGLLAATAHAGDCAALYQAQAANIKDMDLTTFDRTMGKGWRVLDDANCFLEGAKLIGVFQAVHHLESDSEAASLYLHKGQMLLRLDQRDEAAENFRRAVRQDRTNSEFKYNDFVLALASYAKRDRPSFDLHMAEVEKFPQNYGNKTNLRLLKHIAENFNDTYLQILAIHTAAVELEKRNQKKEQ